MKMISTKVSTKVSTRVVIALVTILVGAVFPCRAALTKAGSGDLVLELAKLDGEETNEPAASDAWLGVSTSEASETLISQLGLPAGVGLVINFVATNSPAAKAGLQKNDVLVRFEEQELVLPAQLRKLVLMRKEGDKVKLGYYRAGKEHSTSVTLGKTARHASWDDTQRAFEMKLNDFKHLFENNDELKDRLNEHLKAFRDSLGNIRIDGEVRDSIRRGMADVHNAIREALQNTTNVDGSVRKALEELARSRVMLDDKSSVIVRSADKGVKSLVKSDDSGTIVLLSSPKLHLTAHDKEGKLLFDGEIETDAQRDAVPRELWQRVEPLLEKMAPTELEEPGK
jgi:hypothetical protein